MQGAALMAVSADCTARQLRHEYEGLSAAAREAVSKAAAAGSLVQDVITSVGQLSTGQKQVGAPTAPLSILLRCGVWSGAVLLFSHVFLCSLFFNLAGRTDIYLALTQKNCVVLFLARFRPIESRPIEGLLREKRVYSRNIPNGNQNTGVVPTYVGLKTAG